MMARRLPQMAVLPAFFVAKILCALLLLKLSSTRLDVSDFAVFSQMFLFSALINMIAVGGSQNGIIRFAAIAGSEEDLGRTRDAGLALCAAAALFAGVPLAASSYWIADLLTGQPGIWPSIVAILVLNFAGGPGQVWCSMLTGRDRVPASIAAQALGLLCGTGLAAVLLLRGEPLLAAIGYSLGPIAMTLGAAVPFRRLGLPARALALALSRARELLRFSGAFLVLAVATPSILFALRGIYQDHFGMGLLGYWLTASRVSDTTTQLMSLFVVQYFLPALARTEPGSREARLQVLRACLMGFAAMAAIPAVFALAPEFFVVVFLDEQFLPAIPLILFYMVGDVARVWSAVAMQAAFARGRLLAYIAIELVTIAVMAAILIPLTIAKDPRGPMIAYPAAYGLAAIVLTAMFALRRPARSD